MISDPYGTTDIQSLTHSYYLQKGWNKDIALSLREFREENIGSSAVDPQEESGSCTYDRTKTISRCVSLCFQRTVIDKIGCRLFLFSMNEILFYRIKVNLANVECLTWIWIKNCRRLSLIATALNNFKRPRMSKRIFFGTEGIGTQLPVNAVSSAVPNLSMKPILTRILVTMTAPNIKYDFVV